MTILSFIEGLVETCEQMIFAGHNTEFRDPYEYTVAKLLILREKHDEMRAIGVRNDAMVHHFSRLAIACGKQEPFMEVLKQVTGE